MLNEPGARQKSKARLMRREKGKAWHCAYILCIRDRVLPGRGRSSFFFFFRGLVDESGEDRRGGNWKTNEVCIRPTTSFYIINVHYCMCDIIPTPESLGLEFHLRSVTTVQARREWTDGASWTFEPTHTHPTHIVLTPHPISRALFSTRRRRDPGNQGGGPDRPSTQTTAQRRLNLLEKKWTLFLNKVAGGKYIITSQACKGIYIYSNTQKASSRCSPGEHEVHPTTNKLLIFL